jgi:hypothetical protein
MYLEDHYEWVDGHIHVYNANEIQAAFEGNLEVQDLQQMIEDREGVDLELLFINGDTHRADIVFKLQSSLEGGRVL